MTADEPRDAGVVAAGPRFRSCRGRPAPAAVRRPWRHSHRSPLTTGVGDANHSAHDAIGERAEAVKLRGKFAYGWISKDLEDESVAVWIDDGTGWVALGEHVTDDDGRIEVDLPAGVVTAPGVYEAAFQVIGDGSRTSALVWILPRGSRLALTDIDGTLTSSDFQVFAQILDGRHVPVAYSGAVDLTAAHAERGHIVLYLTGRPYYLTRASRDWLAGLGFAPGPLHVTDSNHEAAPTERGVGDFKLRFIERLITAGYTVDVAYGNAATDVRAYLEAGLAPGQVWIIGSHGGLQGTHAGTHDWRERAAAVAAGPSVIQPFDR